MLECCGAHLDRLMKTLIPQREHFAGPQQLSPAWTLVKRGRSAVCTIWSREFGFEVRLVLSGDPLPRTEVPVAATEDV